MKKGERPRETSASRGRSPSVAARCAADSPGIRCDPPDPMFPAVSVPTLGSGCMAKQCSPSSASPRGDSSCSSSAAVCVARSSAPADSASLLELRVRLYLTRDRLHGPHRRSLAVARDDTELDDLPRRIWRSPRRHSIIGRTPSVRRRALVAGQDSSGAFVHAYGNASAVRRDCAMHGCAT